MGKRDFKSREVAHDKRRILKTPHVTLKEEMQETKNVSANKGHLREVTIEGKDVKQSEGIRVVTENARERGKKKKKKTERLEISIRVGGKRWDSQGEEETGNAGRGEGSLTVRIPEVRNRKGAESVLGGREEGSGGRICQDCRKRGVGLSDKKELEAREEEERDEGKKEETELPRIFAAGDWRLPEEAIVENLRFSLDQLRLAGEEESYMDLVEMLVAGPARLTTCQMEQLLGINPDLRSRAQSRRTTAFEDRRLKEVKVMEATSRRNLNREELPKGPPDLLAQFQMFSKFGESGSDGSQITLTQSDKWLRQAKVIDGWNVTTTDTAIAFRKIGKGSVRLSFSSWRLFLQALSDEAGLNIAEVGGNINISRLVSVAL